MPSELANDPKRPGRDEDDVDDESAEDDEDDSARDRDAGALKRDLEIADEFEPTLDVPLPISDKPSRKRSRR
jgi:hypothetical protein